MNKKRTIQIANIVSVFAGALALIILARLSSRVLTNDLGTFTRLETTLIATLIPVVCAVFCWNYISEMLAINEARKQGWNDCELQFIKMNKPLTHLIIGIDRLDTVKAKIQGLIDENKLVILPGSLLKASLIKINKSTLREDTNESIYNAKKRVDSELEHASKTHDILMELISLKK